MAFIYFTFDAMCLVCVDKMFCICICLALFQKMNGLFFNIYRFLSIFAVASGKMCLFVVFDT